MKKLKLVRVVHELLTGDDHIDDKMKEISLKMDMVISKTIELCSDIKKYVSEASELNPDDAIKNPDMFRGKHMLKDSGYEHEHVRDYFDEAKSDLLERMIVEVRNEVYYAFGYMNTNNEKPLLWILYF